MTDTDESRPAATGTDARIEDVLAQMTLEEKAALTVGRDSWTTVPLGRLGIPSVWLSDGPTGLRKARSGSDTSPDFDLCVGASSRDIGTQACVTLAGVSARTAPLGRLSPLRDWLAHLATRERLQPVVSTLQRRLFGRRPTCRPQGPRVGM